MSWCEDVNIGRLFSWFIYNSLKDST
jgi:hypothetical protein